MNIDRLAAFALCLALTANSALAAGDGPGIIHPPANGVPSYFADYLSPFASGVSLPRVTVTGRRSSATVCRGAQCEEFLRALSEKQLRDQAQFMGFSLEDAIEIANIVKMSACTLLRNSPANMYNITALDPDELRWKISSQIIDSAVANLRIVVTRKMVITVELSDGTTEDFQYASLAGMHIAVPGSFKPGTGVPGSACKAVG